jgi:hypothetical protein
VNYLPRFGTFSYKLNMQLQAVDKIKQNSLNKTNFKNMFLIYSIYINIVHTFFPQNIPPKTDSAYIIYNKICEVLILYFTYMTFKRL